MVCSAMKSWSSASHCSNSEPNAWNSARSPLIRTGRWRSASWTPEPTHPRGRCGFLNPTSPASFSGLMAMILAPRPLASSSADSIRGWLVPGFWPAKISSFAAWTSSRVTLALPMPIDSASAMLVDSWHMLEQSGRLLVPYARTNSWYANAASLDVRPEV